MLLACARAFVVGLSDEAGAAANVALAVKARHSPTREQAARLDEYIQRTLWGVEQDIPFPVSLQDHATGGIRASLFWVPTPVRLPPSSHHPQEKIYYRTMSDRCLDYQSSRAPMPCFCPVPSDCQAHLSARVRQSVLHVMIAIFCIISILYIV